MAHFVAITIPIGCHCNPDHDKFHLYLIQLVVIFPNVVYGDIVYAQTWKVLPQPPSYPMLLHHIALVSFRRRLFRKKIGQLAIIFWVNSLPPHLAKNFQYAYEQCTQLMNQFFRKLRSGSEAAPVICRT